MLFGVAAASAILTGAFIVGDSVRGSLQNLALDRLGKMDALVVGQRFFRQKLAPEWAQRSDPHGICSAGIAVVASLESTQRPVRRAANINLLGLDSSFSLLDNTAGQDWNCGRDEMLLSSELAQELDVGPNDEVLLRLPVLSNISPDSPLGRKSERVNSRRFRVARVLHSRGLAHWSLSPAQQAPRNAFIALETAQEMTDQIDGANILFLSEPKGIKSSAAPPFTLEDLGIRVAKSPRGYWNITCKQLLLPQALVEGARRLEPDSSKRQETLAYLANSLEVGNTSLAYATVVGCDPSQSPPLGPLVTTEGTSLGSIADDEVVLNDWSATRLNAKVGDTLTMRFFEPESTHGETVERTPAPTFRVSAIVKLEGAADDSEWTPEVEGITDQASIADWNPPFPFELSRVTQDDEDYWKDHKATPKAFISLNAARALWSSRFGDTTSVRLDSATDLAEDFLKKSQLDSASLGAEVRNIRQDFIAASRGATPFEVLFLGFSMFIIASALMLVAILFRLAMERRGQELGTVLSLGWSPGSAFWLYAGEGMCVAALGTLLGAALGRFYAQAMLYGLKHWWVAAISTPFLELHVTLRAVLLGMLCALLMAIGVMLYSLRGMAKMTARQLLSQNWDAPRSPRANSWTLFAQIGFLALTVVLVFLASKQESMAQAGLFFGAGMCMLTAGLLFFWSRLKTAQFAPSSMRRGPIAYLARRSIGRRAFRSAATIALVAMATFIIISMGAFQLEPELAGSGGYELFAETSQPVLADLSDDASWEEFGLPAEERKRVDSAEFLPFRVRGGDDASCLNLYEIKRPRILGAPLALTAGQVQTPKPFAWSSSMDGSLDNKAWSLLAKDLGKDAQGRKIVPMILDAATAMYSLKLSGVGADFAVNDEAGKPVTFRVVGLLANSIFQGSLLIHERDFRALFPTVAGYRLFLIHPHKVEDVLTTASALEDAAPEFGFDVQESSRKLASFLAVQNTYLQTFQSLGALGLLLGTLGLAAVQTRNVWERQKEFALMQSLGFLPRQVAEQIARENLLLLTLGLALGLVAAAVSTAPYLASGRAVIPWLWMTATLVGVILAGQLSGLFAVKAAMSTPITIAMRRE